MSAIVVESPGMLTTVQDLGRWGYGAIGVSPAGAADPVALRIGNRLVANPPHAAALEMTLLGGGFRFPDGALIALAGAKFESTLDGRPVAPWTAVEIRAGQVLHVKGAPSGARCYLCVRGGIATPVVLGSRSTHVPSGLGGRALKKGDVLPIGAPDLALQPVPADPAVLGALYADGPFRITPSLQTDWFSAAQRAALAAASYFVSNSADRMGLRLDGPRIPCPAGGMVTEGVALGAIQVPPAGEPIILFVDQQTTGGYPKIANIITADLHRAGQLRPRDLVRFEWVTPETARAELLDLERRLA